MNIDITSLKVEITCPKEDVYRSLSVINDSLKLVLEHLERSKAVGALPAKLTDIYCATIQQVKSEVSQLITNRMGTLELLDASRLEKLRLALEQELKQGEPKPGVKNGNLGTTKPV